MAVQKRVTKSGTTRWVARIRDDNRKERSKSFNTRREAKAWEERVQSEIRQGEWIAPEIGAVTVGKLAHEWADQPARDNTKANREALARNLGPLKDMPINKVRSSDVSAWHAELIHGRSWKSGKTLSANTAANLAGMLSGLFARAVDDKMIRSAPKFTMRKSARSSLQRADILTTKEVEALILRAGEDHFNSPARPWLATMIAVAAGSGLRVSELGGLKVENVDFLRGQIHVRQQSNNGGTGLVALKSDSARRSVPVPDSVFEVLERYLHDFPREPGQTVFYRVTDGVERLHSKNSAGTALRRLQSLHGLRKKSFHDFRHYYATVLIAGGAPVNVVQSALGHANPTTTMETYVHFWPGSEELTREAASVGVDFLRDHCGIGARVRPDEAIDQGVKVQVVS